MLGVAIVLAAPAAASVSLPHSIDGSPENLRLWLRADEGVIRNAAGDAATHGDTVRVWRDQSGQNNHASQTSSGRRFTYRIDNQTINGLPTLQSTSGKWMQGASGFGSGNPTVTYFVVGQIAQASGTRDWPAILTSRRSGQYQDRGIALNMAANSTRLYTNADRAVVYPDTDPQFNPFLASAVDESNSENNAYRLTNFTNDSQRTFNGNIAEVLVFNRELNEAERIVMENYLGAKYGIAVADNERYAAGDYNHNLDVFGIGRHTDGSQLLGSAWAGLALSADSLDDGQWLMAGHKTPENDWTTNDVPAGLTERWDRVWYLHATGNPDAVNVTFDFLAGGGLALDSDQGYRLLYSAENDFNFVILPDVGVGTIDIAEQTVTFAGLSGLQSGYYTLGVPEPGAWLLLLSALACGLLVRRRR